MSQTSPAAEAATLEPHDGSAAAVSHNDGSAPASSAALRQVGAGQGGAIL